MLLPVSANTSSAVWRRRHGGSFGWAESRGTRSREWPSCRLPRSTADIWDPSRVSCLPSPTCAIKTTSAPGKRWPPCATIFPETLCSHVKLPAWIHVTELRTSALEHALQRVEEPRIGNNRRVGAADLRFSFGTQGGNRECHGNAVIAESINLAAAQLLTARNFQPILPLFYLRSHDAQVCGDSGDAIGFLHA